MRPTLTNLEKPQTTKPRDDFARLEDGHRAHLRDLDRLCADKLGFDWGFAILEQHGDYFLKIGLQFVETVTLAMCARESGHVADIGASLGVAFDDSGKGLHRTRGRDGSEVLLCSLTPELGSKQRWIPTGGPET